MPIATINGLKMNYVIKSDGIPFADTVKRWIRDSVAMGVQIHAVA